MKSLTFILVLTSSLQVLASSGSSELSSLLKDRDGNTLIANSLESAAEACAEEKMTLPTARDMAQLGKQRGAVGITEVKDSAQASAGSYLVDVREGQGQVEDRFLYSNEGYQASRDDVGVTCLWTSSLNPNHPLTYNSYLVTFNTEVGALHTQTSNYRNTVVSCAVKCKK